MARTISRSAAERSNRALFIAALLFAGLAAVLFLVFLLRLSNDNGGTTAVAGDVNVVVASQDILAGTKITDDMLSVKQMPSDVVTDGAWQSEDELQEGQVARSLIYEGDQILPVKVGDAVLDDSAGSAVEDNAVVVGVGVEDAASIVGGLLQADDIVDVILVREIETAEGTQQTQACMVAQAVSVFAVADVFNEAIVQGQEGDATTSEDFESNPEAQSVQLEVSGVQALNVKRAEGEGSVSLALRSNQNTAQDTSLPGCY